MIIFAICIIAIGVNLSTKLNKGISKAPSNQTGNTNTTPETPIEPNIKIEFEGEPGKVKISITSDKNMQNVDYWWDDEEPISLQPNDTKYETVVDSRQGTHTLNIEVRDIDGNTKTADQVVIGDSVPELELSTDGVSNYIIRAKDDEKIDKIVIILNENTQEINVNNKEFEYSVPIPEGDSLIDVTVYNLNGLSANKKGKITNFTR